MSAQGLGLKAAYSILNGTAAVTAVATGGIFSYAVKQGANPPLILITEEDVLPEDTKSDTTSGATVNRHIITISVYSLTRAVTESLSALVDAALNHYSGTTNSVVVGDIRFTGSSVGFQEEIYYKDMDYEIWTKQ